MIKNVKVELSANSSLLLRWQWKDNKDATIPSCNVFFCSRPENTLLEKGLFLESEILNYFNDYVVKIFTPDVRRELEEYHGRDSANSRLSRFRREGNENEIRELPIPPGSQNGIFLVAVYDENEIIFRIVAGGGRDPIPFEEIKPKLFQKLMGGRGSRRTIRLLKKDNRKKVVETRSGRTKVYSVLPEGYDEYYFDENVDLSTIKIYYLSSLIGDPDQNGV